MHHEIFEHVVLVKCDSVPPAIGTGVLVSELAAVTAKHTTNSGGPMSVRSAVSKTVGVPHGNDDSWCLAEVREPREASDTCLLTLTTELREGRPAKVAILLQAMIGPFRVVGFPMVAEEVNEKALEPPALVFGCEGVLLSNQQEGEFTLFPLRNELFVHPSGRCDDKAVSAVFGGLSGAPVFLDSYLVGIVTAAFYAGRQPTLVCSRLNDIGLKSVHVAIAVWIVLSPAELPKELARMRAAHRDVRILAYHQMDGTLTRVPDVQPPTQPSIAKVLPWDHGVTAWRRRRPYRGRH